MTGNVDNVKSDIVDSGLTSKDYYFDSYAHFGIHEVCFEEMYSSVDF